jgi:hypothetical protein
MFPDVFVPKSSNLQYQLVQFTLDICGLTILIVSSKHQNNSIISNKYELFSLFVVFKFTNSQNREYYVKFQIARAAFIARAVFSNG